MRIVRIVDAHAGTIDERGMTLVEIMVAGVISALLVGVLGASYMVSIRSVDDAVTRVDGTQGVRWTARYFARDVQSARDVDVPGASACGVDATPVVAVQLPDSRVEWATVPVEGTTPPTDRLVRRTCREGAVVGEVAISDELLAQPHVTCTPDCGAPSSVRLEVQEVGGATWSAEGTRRSG